VHSRSNALFFSGGVVFSNSKAIFSAARYCPRLS
jgi:hypothetical protein